LFPAPSPPSPPLANTSILFPSHTTVVTRLYRITVDWILSRVCSLVRTPAGMTWQLVESVRMRSLSPSWRDRNTQGVMLLPQHTHRLTRRSTVLEKLIMAEQVQTSPVPMKLPCLQKDIAEVYFQPDELGLYRNYLIVILI
jgi:hypothetical protein